jgi:hypothetical protein
MEIRNVKERIKKYRREKPGRGIGAVSRKNPGNGELMKYYCHREAAVSLNETERLFSFGKKAEEERR